MAPWAGKRGRGLDDMLDAAGVYACNVGVARLV